MVANAMRDMTNEELDYVFHTGRCPLCGDRELLEGGSGGMSLNLWCGNCRGGINLMGPSQIVNLGGQVIREPEIEVTPPDLRPPQKFLLPGGFVGSLCALFAWIHPKIEERSLKPHYLDERAWPE